jgi:hypothetical protein
MEEDVAPPRSDTLPLGGTRSTRSPSMWYTEPRGHTNKPLIPPRRSTSSSSPPPYTLRCPNGFFIKTEEEEEERRVRLEKRLVPNFDFDDNTLQMLDSTWISNLEQPWMGAILYGVGVNIHMELDSEVLMT